MNQVQPGPNLCKLLRFWNYLVGILAVVLLRLEVGFRHGDRLLFVTRRVEWVVMGKLSFF